MKKVINTILLVPLLVLSIRVTTLESKIVELEKDLINKTNKNSHRMQDYEQYIEYLKREYEPYIQEQWKKSINERL